MHIVLYTESPGT